MFSAFVCSFIFLHHFVNILSVAVYPPGREDAQWFVGCVNAADSSDLRLRAPKGDCDLDPVTCCVRCLDEGYQLAALTLESCHCGSHSLQGLAVSECFNKSAIGGSKDVRGDSERQSVLHLPVGGGQGIVALYRTEGPFLRRIGLSTSPVRVQAGKTFILEVSGSLAGCPNQPTGVLSLGRQDLSYVTVEFLTPKSESLRRVNVSGDGSFVVPSDWIFKTPGEYEINISVSNALSTLSSTLHLPVSQPPPDGLVISVLHGLLGVPSCIASPGTDSHMQAAFLGDPVTLQVHVGEGLATGFCWWFTQEKGEENKSAKEERTCVKTACFTSSDCLNSTLNWTFETEGVHTVSVNASNADGWTQQKIYIIVVHLIVSDLKVSTSETQMTAGEGLSVDVELFTTMKHLLLLSLTLNVKLDKKYEGSNNISSREKEIKSCTDGSIDMKDHLHHDKTSNINKPEHLARTNAHYDKSSDHGFNYSNHGNKSYGHHLSGHHNNYLFHTSSHSSCHLHLHLHCPLPTTVGEYHLIASVRSATDPSSVLLSTVLPQALMVHEHICALRPSESWMSVVPTHADVSLEVVSHARCMVSRVVWTFSLDNTIVMNRTTENRNINVSFPQAGCYRVTVQAFNPINQNSFQTHILVQDPVGGLVLNAPSVMTTNQQQVLLFSVAAGSNVTVSLLVNATLLYRNSSYATREQAMVALLFDHTGTVVVELRAENQVSSQNKSVRLCIEGNRQPPTHPVDNLVAVRIYAAKEAYPTNTDITLLVVADVPDPVEFTWYFGDSKSVRTTSRTFTKRYSKPGRFDVSVVMSSGQTSVTSKVFQLEVQRAVKLNRLVHQASVLQNHTVMVSCWVNVGTNLTFLWSFGDGSSRLGQSTEQHVYHRTGEFRVEVTVSNQVSSASLSSHMFVVDRPCQPPPVKNMGPLKLQVQRYEVIHLGVTYENEIDCDTSGDLHYTWVLFDSAGQMFPLPLIDTHRQSLTLPSHLLYYDTYTAIAKVQVLGSVVYSNYSVRIEVMQSSPVAFIHGGTNIFINNRNTTLVTLDGQTSYDPDFPLRPLSYRWTCKPVSSITSSCFNQHLPTSSPVLTFPASFLKGRFDQFQFTLTIHSSEKSASSETFLTVAPRVLGKVLVYCPHCQGDQVNWDQSFSVSALCEDCDVSPKHIQYSWSLYVVNASSRPVIEVPFCHSVDLSAPSTIIKGPATSPQTPSGIDTSNYNRASAPLTSRARAKKINVNLTESFSQSNPSTISAVTAGQGEDLLYHPLGEFEPPVYPPSSEYSSLAFGNSGIYPDHLSDVFSGFPIDFDSSLDSEFPFPVLETGDVGDRRGSDYEVTLPSAEEGDPGISAGRRTGVDGETLSLGEDSLFDPGVQDDEGSNLVDAKAPVRIQEPTVLDLHRDLVDRGVFESYTYTGTSSPLLSFRPFSLRPGSRFMLEVTAKSHDGFLGRSQLFFKTKPAPNGMMCQVQPVKGMELHTHFSIFCTSGKEDLLYKYSFSVGGRPPRILYQGRDFQYYFRLPSGDPSDDYKVTIYTEIRSSVHGTATKPCPVTVQVQPSFFRDSSSTHADPDLELSESGLRNLSALVRLGNSMEIRNYISLLSSILNRLNLDTEANTRAQTHIRNVLICTMSQLESREQQSLEDNICVLKDLLQITSQVSFTTAKLVLVHIQAISDRILESSIPVQYHMDNKTLNTLIALLSYTLQAVVTNHGSTLKTPHSVSITQALESDSHTGENIIKTISAPKDCIPDSSPGVHIERGGLISTREQMEQLVADILETTSDLMLKYMLFHETQEHRVSTGLIALYATHQNSRVISSGSTTFYIPVSLNHQLLVHMNGGSENGQRRPCVLSVLTELAHNPYTWGPYPTQLSGPVVDLSLYKCSTRRKIHIRLFVQPVNVELQHPQRNSSVHEYVLHHKQVNYHSFNITQEHLQQAIQFSVVFMSPPGKVFPVTLLFRMFDRPTPSMNHLHRIHRWESNTTRITLPPSYLSAAGVAHLALLNAGKAPRHKHLSEQISYSLTAHSSLCLSWDGHQGAWTHHGCRTQQAHTATAVNCSCHQLRPLSVVQHQINGRFDTAHLDSFLSVSSDLTVPGVLVLCVCLYILGMVVCRKDEVLSKQNRRPHYLPDNSPFDSCLYAVTIHTGLSSAAQMSAKVYIVLYGEDGASQTRELQVPGYSLFRRNSRDTFILSTADSLGPVWGVCIWHDNSGPSPHWYLKQVEVFEVNREHGKGRAWLFAAQCWLAVNKGDGQVERKLRICTEGVGFAKMLCLKLSDYLADFHIWISVFSCPSPNLFTHSQRLTVCLLLLSGYSCVNALIISQMDEQLPFDLGIIDVSASSLRAGLLSVLAVLPAAAMIAFLFRWREVKLLELGDQQRKNRNIEKSCFEDGVVVTSFQQQTQEAGMKKYQGTDLLSASTSILENKDTDKQTVIQPDRILRKEDSFTCGSRMGPVLQHLLQITEGKSVHRPPQEDLSESNKFSSVHKDILSSIRYEMDEVNLKEEHLQEKCSSDCAFEEVQPRHSVGHDVLGRGFRPTSQWCHYLAWALCLLLSLSCLVLSAWLGMRFCSSKVLLWIHSLFFSLMSCIFLVQPALILTVAVIVCFWYRQRPDFHHFSSISEFEMETSKLWCHTGDSQSEEHFSSSDFPQERCSHVEELLRVRQRARYLRLVHPPTPAELKKSRGKKRRETLIHNSLRDLSICVSVLFLLLCITCGSSFSDHYHLNTFVRKQFISRNHNNAFMSIQKHEQWWKWTQASLLNLLYKNASAKTETHILIGEPILWKMEVSRSFQGQVSSMTIVPERLRLFSGATCGHLGCYSVPSATVGLGPTKSEAASKLKHLHSSGWLSKETVALKVQFTLYSPAPNLFTSVTLLTEQSPSGVLLPSSTIQSVRAYHIPAVWDYVTMICQLLFLLLSLLQLSHQVYTVRQQGLMGYCRTPGNWLEVTLLTVILVYYVYYIYLSIITMEVVELLQRRNYREHVDVSLLATWEQHIRTLRAITLFLLTTKFVILLRTLSPSTTQFTCSPSSLFWPTISGLILLVGLSCVGNLLFVQSSWAFSSLPHSLQTVFCHYRGLRTIRGLFMSGRDLIYRGVLYLSSTVVWTAVAIGVMSSMVRSARRLKNRRTVFSVAEIASYIRHKVLQQRHPWTDNCMERRTYYLEEFESVVDELLFRLNALSNGLHYTLPPKDHRYMEQSPVTTPTQERSSVDTQDFVRIQMADETNVSGHVESMPAPHLLRSKLELKILQLLQDRGQWRNNPSLQIIVPSDNLQHPGIKAEENSNDQELQTYSLIKVWTEDVLEKKSDQWTKTENSCWLSKSQAAHTEVVVEALVHEEPHKQ